MQILTTSDIDCQAQPTAYGHLIHLQKLCVHSSQLFYWSCRWMYTLFVKKKKNPLLLLLFTESSLGTVEGGSGKQIVP